MTKTTATPIETADLTLVADADEGADAIETLEHDVIDQESSSRSRARTKRSRRTLVGTSFSRDTTASGFGAGLGEAFAAAKAFARRFRGFFILFLILLVGQTPP
jgi:hypothetical protein